MSQFDETSHRKNQQKAAGLNEFVSFDYTNDYSLGVLWTAIGGAEGQTLYKTIEYLDGSGNTVAVASSKYEAISKNPQVNWASWGANIQDSTWKQVELKAAVESVTADVKGARVTISTAEPTYGDSCTAKAGEWKITQPTELKKSVNFGTVVIIDQEVSERTVSE